MFAILSVLLLLLLSKLHVFQLMERVAVRVREEQSDRVPVIKDEDIALSNAECSATGY